MLRRRYALHAKRERQEDAFRHEEVLGRCAGPAGSGSEVSEQSARSWLERPMTMIIRNSCIDPMCLGAHHAFQCHGIVAENIDYYAAVDAAWTTCLGLRCVACLHDLKGVSNMLLSTC